MATTDFVIYAYGLVSKETDASRFPAGIEDAAVEVQETRAAGVLVSRLPRATYAPAVVERSSGDVTWLSPRAMAHDRVLTWAQEHGGVVPLPMFTMFGSVDALRTSMERRADGITQLFRKVRGADEFGVRIHRRDARMLAAIDDLDPDIAALRRDAAAASTGQRYLLERKLADRSKTAMRAASQRIARQIFESLSAIARDAIARPLTPDPSRVDATLVLNGAFLVDRDRVNEFRAAVGAFMGEYEPRGLAFDFTGPWPPYNFVAEALPAEAERARG